MVSGTLTIQLLPEGQALPTPHGRPSTKEQNEAPGFVHHCLVLLSAILITLRLRNNTNSI